MNNNNINIMDMFGANKSKNDFVIKEIPLTDIINNDNNFYNTEEIKELKASIKAFKLQQNLTVCKMSNGKYKLISGHRRFKAILELVEEKELDWTTVPCRIENLTELEQDLLLIISNSTTRELTPFEKSMQVKEVRNIAEQMSEKDDIKFSVREFIQTILKMSSGEVGRYETINNYLIDEVKEDFEKGNISTDVAYQTPRLPEHKQQEIKEKIVEAAKEDKKITAKDVRTVELTEVIESAAMELQELEDELNELQDLELETTLKEIQKEFDSEVEEETKLSKLDKGLEIAKGMVFALNNCDFEKLKELHYELAKELDRLGHYELALYVTAKYSNNAFVPQIAQSCWVCGSFAKYGINFKGEIIKVCEKCLEEHCTI